MNGTKMIPLEEARDLQSRGYRLWHSQRGVDLATRENLQDSQGFHWYKMTDEEIVERKSSLSKIAQLGRG